MSINSKVRGDLFGGITAAVVALPLALAFGVSSGVGPIAGLYGAIIVGFFAAVFGGTPAQVSGPTGPMTVVMAAIIMRYVGEYPDTGLAIAFTVVMLAGVIQILFGLLRLGKYIILVPFPVISGFMSGVGFIIILLQIGPLLGHDAHSTVLASVQALPSALSDPLLAAAALGALTLAVIFGWPQRLRAVIPAPLAALVIATLAMLLLVPDAGLTRIGEIPSGLPGLNWPVLEPALLRDMLYSAVLLAGLGAIDSLLTSLVADNLTRTHHDSDRELMGQGFGNLLAGLFGALPGAGATMRTVVNIRAGGTSPLSGATHALVLLAIVLGASSLASEIPHAVLAGILIKVGVDIIDWRTLRRIHQLPLFSSTLMLGVLFFTVFVDLITAVMIGVFVANLVTIDRLSHVQLDGLRLASGENDDEFLPAAEHELIAAAQGRVLLLELRGPMSYGVARGINQRLAGYQRHEILVLDLSGAELVGITTALVIEDLIESELAAGRRVLLVQPGARVQQRLDRIHALDPIPEGLRFANRAAALQQALQPANEG